MRCLSENRSNINVMKKISLIEKKKLMLSMLEELDEFCQKNNINYFLTGGTLLGAIRHNGYIPWDDDIDIALLREDYERLLSEFVSKTGYVEIINHRNKKNYIWPFAKMIHKKTLLIDNALHKSAIGVYIDIFPLDYIDASYENAKKQVKRAGRWRRLLAIKHLEVSNKRAYIKNIVIVFARIFNIIPDRVLIEKIEKISRKYENKSESEFVCNFMGAYDVREIVERKDFDSAIKHVFEDKMFKIPIGYDDVLSRTYGDYMTLPPMEKRVGHHDTKEYWI